MIFHVIYLMLFVFKCKYVDIYIFICFVYLLDCLHINFWCFPFFPCFMSFMKKSGAYINPISKVSRDNNPQQFITTSNQQFKTQQRQQQQQQHHHHHHHLLEMNFHLYRTNKICAGTPVPMLTLTRVTEISFTIVRNAKGEPQVGCLKRFCSG